MYEFGNKTVVSFYPPDWANISSNRDYYTQTNNVAISINQQIVDAINWVRRYRTQLEMEAKIRSENPAVASQYECYQAMLKLVKSDHIDT
jgi:hypothetical protein